MRFQGGGGWMDEIRPSRAGKKNRLKKRKKSKKKNKVKAKQVMRGHNTVVDWWAGAANPHPHSMPHLTPFPTQTYTKSF